uniref:non-specific serine/threonine protein kinase n=1 Tax=Phallusia mammillata TaxID=59560 RepID=A0A6F9DUE1_9ASCI|nr:serine/threonine-protein kinase 16-like [Phallusia mammillata]
MGASLSSIGACMCGKGIISINSARYLFQENIGEGGFSYIDLIEDLKSGGNFALKRIVCHDEKAKEDALQEVHFCRMLNHENIITLIDHCIKNKGNLIEVWLVLPFYKNGSLYDKYQHLAAKKENLDKKEVLSIFHGVCKGIEQFHQSDPPLAHRDLKPANVLLSDENTPIIMDLGSVAHARVEINSFKEAQSMQDLAAERCTMPYRAPELFQVSVPSIIDEKVDIWSLGCILFSLMFLEGPFDQIWMRKDSVALAVQNGNIPFPKNNQYPTAYLDLVRSLMEIEPSKRPSILSVIEQIENLT